MRRTRTLTILLPPLIAATGSIAAAQPRADTVPYIPTATPVVSAMLELAEVGPADVLYDLGSGDGRIVISAARLYGASGAGWEIDASLVAASRAAAAAAGVDSLVAFLQQDLLAADLRPASLVTLYLSPELNLALLPKLLRELDPGARVVSHAFHMGDWRPDSVVHVGSGAARATVYLWVVPARLDGFWEMTIGDSPRGSAVLLELEQRFQDLSGSLRAAGVEMGVLTGRIRGTIVELTAHVGSGERWRLQGRLTGDGIEGTYHRSGDPRRMRWRAARFSLPSTPP